MDDKKLPNANLIHVSHDDTNAQVGHGHAINSNHFISYGAPIHLLIEHGIF